jgi:hypothetical protein
MALVTSKGSRIITGLTSAVPALADPGEGGGKVRKWVETIETVADDSTSSTYHMARLPSNSRIFGSSKISHDALGSTTATLDIGVYNTSSRLEIAADDDDAINDGIVASTAGTKDFIKDRANWGKRLWELVPALTSDPKCDLDIKLVIRDANLSSGAGTITVEIDYATD